VDAAQAAMTTLTLTVFLVLLVLGMPIAFVILGTSLAYFLFNPIAPSVLAQRLTGSMESFPLLAVPFFVLAGTAMARGGIAERLFSFADSLVGHWRAGLAQIAVMNSLLIGAMSGSATADAAIDARTLVPVMLKQGYSNGFASVVSACSGVIGGPILPPSIALIIYGLLTSTSVAKLFIGAIIPALLLAAGMMIAIKIIGARRGYGNLRDRRLPAREIGRRARHAMWALAMPVLLLVGLRFGVFTPTELGAIAALYALFVGMVVYQGFRPSDIFDLLRESAHTTANVMIIVAASAALSLVLTFEQVPQAVINWLLAFSTNKYAILLLINIALLVLGMFMEGIALNIILAPVLIQITQKFDIDPVHLGVVVVLNQAIGAVHPPVGTVVYTVCSITKCSVEEYTRELIPIIAVLTGVLFLITFVPELVLFLPRIML
jgi:tripartite ATP-independent transporter DctM subunit